jgi:hypothetical protein
MEQVSLLVADSRLSSERLMLPFSVLYISNNMAILPQNTVFSFLQELHIKIKEPRNIPGVAQRFPGGLGSQIS